MTDYEFLRAWVKDSSWPSFINPKLWREAGERGIRNYIDKLPKDKEFALITIEADYGGIDKEIEFYKEEIKHYKEILVKTERLDTTIEYAQKLQETTDKLKMILKNKI